MTIHVNIGEAKTRLSELIAAAVRGEEVVLAKAGEPQVRLVSVAAASEAQVAVRHAKRREALNMYQALANGRDILVRDLKPNDDALDRMYRRKFGASD